MTAWSCRLMRTATALVMAAGSLAGAGCVSARYKLAPVPPGAPPPRPLAITATAGDAGATLQTVIVFHGPGSWKQDAYWDEYVVTLTAPRDQPLRLTRVELIDQAGELTPAGYDPWTVDAASRERLKVARRTGRAIALGAGAGAAWLGSLVLFGSNLTLCGGVANTTAATVGAAGVVAIPAIVLGSGVRSWVARSRIKQEFDRRRIGLPATIPAGSSRSGSFFFPVTPAPARLRLHGQAADGAPFELPLDLARLAGLHLKPTTGPGTELRPSAGSDRP